jgi:transcriptional regulator with XRE-family HTH domain
MTDPPKKATAARPELQPFVDALTAAMEKRNLTASDLARALWGTTKDTRGYDVAKGRDRIGYFLRGVHFPDHKNLQKLAKALGVTVEKLKAGIPATVLAWSASPRHRSADKATTGNATEDKTAEAKAPDPVALPGPLELLRVQGQPDKMYVRFAEPLDIELAKKIAALVLSHLAVEPQKDSHQRAKSEDRGA